MPGMLTEGQVPPPSSAPGPQTPPAGNPGVGTPLPSDSASGAGQPPAQEPSAASFEELRDLGVKKLYGENFDKMLKMFETNGPEKFPKSMAVAVNTTITALEKESGPLPPEMAAEVGIDIMMKLLEDIIGEQLLPGVTLEQIQQATPAILLMYADSHPEVSKEDIQGLLAEVQRGVGEAQGQPPTDPQAPPAPAPLSTGPGPEPSGSPVPPGAI